MGKAREKYDFAELARRATKEPRISRLWVAPVLIITGHLLMLGSLAAFVMGMWAFIVSLAAGIVCYWVGFHDDDIRVARMWHKRVLEGPSEKLKTSAARSLLSWRLVAFPAVCVGGLATVSASNTYGFLLPDWLVVTWMLTIAFLWVFCIGLAAIIGDRGILGKIEAYQRSQEQQQAEFDDLKQEVLDILDENQDDFPDLEDLEEVTYDYTMKEIVGMLEQVWELAEEVKADEGMPEYARELAEKILTKLKRMRELAGA
jgi:hypothetical protein